jgi:hypothetical protein
MAKNEMQNNKAGILGTAPKSESPQSKVTTGSDLRCGKTGTKCK